MPLSVYINFAYYLMCGQRYVWRPPPGVLPSEFHCQKNETFVIFLKMFHCDDLSAPNFYLALILHIWHMHTSVSEKVLISGKQWLQI